MPTHVFKKGTEFVWRGVRWHVVEVRPKNYFEIADGEGNAAIVSREELITAFGVGELVFVDKSRASGPGPDKHARKNRDLSDYDPNDVAIARYRYVLIAPLIGLYGAELANAIEACLIEHKPQRSDGKPALREALSENTIRRWLRTYRASGEDIRSLIPRTKSSGGVGKSRLRPEVEAIIQDVIDDIYMVKEAVTIDHVYSEVQRRIDDGLNRDIAAEQHFRVPSRVTVWRRVQELDAFEVDVVKIGKEAAKKKRRQYGKMPLPEYPNQRWEIDHSPLDIIVHGYKVRPNLTWIIDVCTGLAMGFYLGFEPPGYMAVMEAVYHAILPKTDAQAKYGLENGFLGYGLPQELVVDNAPEFTGHDLEDFCLSHGITLTSLPRRSPEKKPFVERLYRSLNTEIHALPGTTFSNPTKRGDYDSAARAVLSLDALYYILHVYIVDIHAQRLNRRRRTVPAREWQRKTEAGFFPRLPSSSEALLMDLGRVSWRMVHHYGIQIASVTYNCAALGPLRDKLEKGEKVKVKMHLGDIGHIHVFDHYRDAYISVPAVDPADVAGLSYWQYRLIRKKELEQADKSNERSIARGRYKIREQAKAAEKNLKKGEAARWNTTPPSLQNQSSGYPNQEVHEFDEGFTEADWETDLSLPAEEWGQWSLSTDDGAESEEDNRDTDI